METHSSRGLGKSEGGSSIQEIEQSENLRTNELTIA